MRKILSVGMATLASILLILILLFTSIGFVINDETFVNNEFTKLAIGPKMGMTNTDLVTSFNRLVDYMEGDATDINVTVTIDPRLLAKFDEATRSWRIAKGAYRVMLGGASDALGQPVTVTLAANAMPAAWRPPESASSR